MIKLENVSKVFKTDFITHPFLALDNVSFEVPMGSMVGFLGANGAGKTTSLKVIMDFIRPTSGQVKFSSGLGKNRHEIFKNIGYLPERPYFYPSLSGYDFLHFMGSLSGLTKSQVNDEVKNWAPRFKIDHALKRELKTYSKGMLQRIGFLATILHHPQFVILDEPLSGLDPVGRKELKDVIVEVYKQGKTVFFSSHIVPDVEEICDRVIFLAEGKVIYDGSVGSLINDSLSSEYTLSIRTKSDFVPECPFKSVLNLPEELQKYTVEVGNFDRFMLEMVQNNFKIISVEMKKPTLEEIFYKTKG